MAEKNANPLCLRTDSVGREGIFANRKMPKDAALRKLPAMKYFGRSFPSGNQYQLSTIEENLRARGVIFESRDTVLDDGRIQRRYKFAESEVEKLPQDGPGPYIPLDSDSGYSIWEMADKEWNEP